ncbi:MAG: hypothetical protein SWC96_03930 [Thermodesulfobacteriota bacterium]|nr:hypothetical protein [Thermodesulfobacteriota bacterium]
METKISEVKTSTTELSRLLDQYEREMAKIDQNLKPEIVRQREQEIKAEFQKPMDSARSELNANLEGMEKAMDFLLDPHNSVLLMATGSANPATNDDLFFAGLIPAMTEDHLLFLVSETQSPAVVLAIAAEASKRGLKDSEGKIDQAMANFIPKETIDAMVATGKEGFEVLLRDLNVTGPQHPNRAERQLHLGHQIDGWRQKAGKVLSKDE